MACRTTVTTRTVTLIALGGTTTALLAAVPGPVPLLVLLAITAGMVRGNLTLLQATAVTDRWGTIHDGRLSGILGAPVTIASAISPVAGAALAGPLSGYRGLFVLLAAVSALAALLAAGSKTDRRDAGTWSLPRRSARPRTAGTRVALRSLALHGCAPLQSPHADAPNL